MILPLSNNPKYFKFLMLILLAITTALCILLIIHHRQTLALEKELTRINCELHSKEVIHDQRMKEFEKEEKKKLQQVLQLKSEILSKLKKRK